MYELQIYRGVLCHENEESADRKTIEADRRSMLDRRTIFDRRTISAN